jgi:hypothetical protein
MDPRTVNANRQHGDRLGLSNSKPMDPKTCSVLIGSMVTGWDYLAVRYTTVPPCPDPTRPKRKLRHKRPQHKTGHPYPRALTAIHPLVDASSSPS